MANAFFRTSSCFTAAFSSVQPVYAASAPFIGGEA
jgi:hypothetical protein